MTGPCPFLICLAKLDEELRILCATLIVAGKTDAFMYSLDMLLDPES